MSDISDVLVLLANTVSEVLYPNGTTNMDGTNKPSIVGSDIVIYPGWPASDNLDKDLLAGKAHVSVFPKSDDRNTTRYKEKRIVTKAPIETLILTEGLVNVDHLQLEGGGNILLEDDSSFLLETQRTSVTVGGTVTVPQNVMLRVSGKDYVYSVQPADTLITIAASLAALVANDISGTVSQGPTIIIGIGRRLQAARVGGFGTVTREIKRQERIVMLTVWAPNPTLRDTIASAIDITLAAKRFLTMPDGYGARLIYKSSPVIDSLQKAALYRRDLNYSVEFATTIAEQSAAVIAPKMTINSNYNSNSITV